MTKDEAMKLLIESYDRGVEDAKQEALAALEKTVAVMVAAQLAQQEPVAWMSDRAVGFKRSEFGATPTVPLYTSPPAQRTWVGLTDEEVWDLWNSYTEEPFPEWFVDFKRSYKVLEAKLKEKNT